MFIPMWVVILVVLGIMFSGNNENEENDDDY